MVTENGNPRYPLPLGESDLRGRRKIPHPPRLDPLKIDPRAPRTVKSTPRSSPRSPHYPYHPRSQSPLPPAAPNTTDDRPWLPESLRAGSPQGREEWRAKQNSSHAPPFTPPPDRTPPMWYRDNDLDRPNHRKAPSARGGLRISMSTSRLHSRRPRPQVSPDRSQETGAHGLPLPRFPSKGPADDNTLRTSFNSAMTSRSSIEHHSGTERSSVLTKSSSITDLSPDTPDAPYGMDGGMSVEDAISMYLDGFSDVAEEPSSPTSRAESKAPSVTPPPSRDTYPEEVILFPPRTTSLEHVPPIHPPPQSDLPEPDFVEPASSQPHIPEPILEFVSPPQTPPPHHVTSDSAPPDPILPDKASPDSQPRHQRQPSKIIIPGPVPPPLTSANATRDEYGFRKTTQYVTLDQYEAWKGTYSNYAAQRQNKWLELLKEHGLQTTNPTVFPAQSSKVKRFVRKGIPSEFRGAAWFWYAGGYELLNRHPGHYDQLVEKVMATPSNDDKEHIERDLHRTFPDNIHFKPDPVDTGGPQNSNVTTETQMIQSLRRVLYTFALHNPKVGYTQSLNFITGMLLLFLPEEKAFWMLHIITSVYLPGTHEVSLEGANIDLWILMVLLRDSMPPIYSKIASIDGSSGRGKAPALTVNSRLPDITLGLTNWLMSIFIGTLPLETTLRVWDIFFYEGSKTFFRVSLAIFKACEKDILGVSDPMEVFQVVQTVPKRLLDANALLEDCFVRRHRVGQGRIEELRAARRVAVRQEKLRRSVAFNKGQIQSATDNLLNRPRNGGPDIEQRVAISWRNLKQHAFHREPTR
ncbi:GTPase-activating protein gyp3 [Penicillium daleae]|uniref:GTPase-activating protein gyp3 n=1 Tax=Penicillium daleae TaxID=63821 RepID=A0AAD6G063_9EURO|nr:GTPase-activating protein gyp3 [Penicillium daleae]KAJ5439571.1 GTPase-activating protein gyp3 [Penicillium daleae]